MKAKDQKSQSSGAVNSYIAEPLAEKLRKIAFKRRIPASELIRDKILRYCKAAP